MAASKPLIIPWLIKQIDSRQYPGVNWVNQERTEFCIPWKHLGKEDSADDDVQIFKAWAEISGATNTKASLWKRNFRSALSAKGCHWITDNSKDAAFPHKVFRLPQGEQCRRYQEPVVNPTPGLPLASPMPTVENLAEDTPIQGIVYAVPEYFYSPDGLSPAVDKDVLEQSLMGLNIYEPQQVIMQPAEVVSAVVIPEQEHSSTEAMDTDHSMQRMEQLTYTMSTSVVNGTLSTQFKVSAYYRGVKVLEQLVENNAGFKVLFRPENTSSSAFARSDPGLTPIYLPGTDQVTIVDKKQARHTKRVLENLGDGLEVLVGGSSVYGLRRGGSKIYWSLCKFPNSNIPQEVSKQERQMLYSVKDFIQDPEHKPWEKQLIMLEVILTSLELLKLLAVEGGASSLQSAQLQISDKPSLMDVLEQWMDTLES
ncbi:interferon regulatory factor 3-like isoform X2 [Anguilla anguilla]|uniref:interferon regulatory factor 3-like isoform X2 n=1 Tax=Anguilla anguilla TaxID=7936 RepID=UPI0015A8671E|nr:interferon regulatory factor 3-like isoform X2 [Anguilla anguilla]